MRPGLAGQLLEENTSQIEQLRQEGRARKLVIVHFEVTEVKPESPRLVYVSTRESWYNEVYEFPSQRLLQRCC